MPAVQLRETVTAGRSGRADRYRLPLQCGLAIIVAAVTGASFWWERYEWWALLAAISALAGLVAIGGWWPRRRGACLIAGIDLLLIFTYLWTFDERVHVVVRATPTGYTATIGKDVTSLNVPVRPGGIGLYAGDYSDYRFFSIGEGFDFADYNQQTDTLSVLAPPDSPLGRFGEFMRLATPRSAWTNIRIQTAGRTVRPADIMPAGGWTYNRRGELEGSLGASMVLPDRVNRRYTLSADLMRGDGAQGLLVVVDSAGRGYLLAIRMDQPDAIWFGWAGGPTQQALGGTRLHVDLLAMIQWDLRLLLGNVIAALLLLMLAPLAYLLAAQLLKLAGSSGTGADAGPETWPLPGWAAPVGVAAIAAAGFAGTAVIASLLLQRIPHVQDSVAYLFQAKTLVMGRLSVPAPKLASFFVEDFIPMHNGQWFGKYPPGWPVLLTIGVLFHSPWLVNPLLTAADLVLIYLIGREVYGGSIGLLGSLLALTSPFVLFLGGSFMAHTATLFYLGGFAYLLIRWVRGVEGDGPMPSGWTLLVPAGFLLGMGFLTRQLDAIAFALPFAGLALSRPVRRRLRAVGWLVAGAIGPGVCLLLYNRALTGSPLISPYSLWWPFDRPGFGPDVGIGGFTPAQGLWNMGHSLQLLSVHLFGWPFYLTLAPALIPFVAGRANRWDALFGLSALSVMAAYLFYWTSGMMYGPRYYFTAVPWFALLTARGLQELSRWVLRLPGGLRRDRLAALIVPGMLLVGLLVYNLSVYLPAQIPVFKGYNYTSAASLDTVRRAGIHHALVFVVTDPPGGWWDYGSVFAANSPLLDGDVVYARDQGAADTSLMRLYPGRRYYRLDWKTLTPLKR